MKKFSNKILIITFLALVALFAGSKLFHSPARESNIDATALVVDTAGITSIALHAGQDSGEIRLQKEGSLWTVSHNGKRVHAQAADVNSLLTALAGLKPQRIVSRKPEKWDQYGVGDTTAVRVVINNSTGDKRDLFVGEESSGNTYVRSDEGAEVFVVNDNLRMKTNLEFNDWRDPAVLRLQNERITKITFEYPADTGYVVEKKGSWMIGGRKADSAAVETYLRQLRFVDHTRFADTFSTVREPDVTVTFQEGAKETVIKGWNTAFYQWVITSSRQPDVYFLDQKMVLPRSIFVGKKKLAGK